MTVRTVLTSLILYANWLHVQYGHGIKVVFVNLEIHATIDTIPFIKSVDDEEKRAMMSWKKIPNRFGIKNRSLK